MSSRLSADREFSQWLERNAAKSAKDKTGQTWELELLSEQTIHPDDTHRSLWKVKIVATTTLNYDSLAGISRIVDKERFWAMIQPKKRSVKDTGPALNLELVVYKSETTSEDEAKRDLAVKFPKLISWFLERDFAEQKWQVLEQALARNCNI